MCDPLPHHHPDGWLRASPGLSTSAPSGYRFAVTSVTPCVVPYSVRKKKKTTTLNCEIQNVHLQSILKPDKIFKFIYT